MSLEDLYADRIEAGIQRDLAAPAPYRPPSFSLWGALSGGAKGIPAGSMQAGASWMDLLSGAQQEGLRHPKPAALADQPDDSARRAADAALFTEGAPQLRAKANEFAPDPATAHTAEQALYGLTRVGTKALAAVGTLGPYAGGAALAAEETNTQYRDLIAKGIDHDTALKVAGVEGVSAGLSVAVPMVGPTIKSTLGLALASGPGAYVAQETAAKKILEKAGYHDEASLHDPTDPLGVGLSTLLPFIAGGIHIAGLKRNAVAPQLADVVQNIESNGRRFDANGQLLTSNKGAQGEMQVMPGTSRDPGFGVAPAKDGSPEELARVGRDYIAAMQGRYGDDAKALAAYNAGPGAVDAAMKLHGDDWLAHLPDETQKYVAKGMKQAEGAGLAHAAADPAVVDAARTRITDAALQRSLPRDLESARNDVLRASDELASGRMPNMPDAGVPEFAPHDVIPAELLQRVRQTVDDNPLTARVLSPEEHARAQSDLAPAVQAAEREKPAFDEALSSIADELGAKVKLAKVKGGDRLLQKHLDDNRGDVTRMRDLVRGSIIVRSMADVPAAVAAIRQKFEVARDSLGEERFKDRFKEPLETGYSDILMNVIRKDGGVAEIQVHVPEMFAAKEAGHKLYDIERTLPEGHERIAALQKLQSEVYAAARDREALRSASSNRANRSSDTASPAWRILADRPGYEYGEPSAANASQEPSGSLTAGTPSTSKNLEPTGNDFIATSEAILRPSDSARNDLPPPEHVAGVTDATPPESKPAVDASRVKQVTEENPDLKVKLPGSDETLSVEAALDRAKAEHAEELKEGDWVKAAIACALSFG